MRRGVYLVIVAMASGLMAASASLAQTVVDVIENQPNSPSLGFQFNFANPGARSVGLGGAFVGVADDATAAFSNPAGLLSLSRQEVSLEVRSVDVVQTVPSSGHIFGLPTGLGIDSTPNDDEALFFEEVSDSTSGLTFLSYVYPVRPGLALAVYRHELANFQIGFETQGIFFNVPIERDLLGEPGFPDISEPGLSNRLGRGSVPLRVSPSRSMVDLQIDNIGLAGAYQISDSFSLGLGVSFYSFDLENVIENFTVDHFLTACEAAPEQCDSLEELDALPFFNDVAFSPDALFSRDVQSGSDDDIGFIVGLLWNVSRNWTLGASYRQGPEFDFTAETIVGPAFGDRDPPGPAETATFHVPDVLSVGLAFRPAPQVKFALDYRLVTYSNLTDEPTVPPFSLEPDEVAVDDADEVHLGFEYVFINAKRPIALRAGAWNDPDHRIRFAEDFRADPGVTDEVERFEQARRRRAAFFTLQGDPNEMHYALGLGVVFSDRFQLDAAADISDLVDSVSVSGVFRF